MSVAFLAIFPLTAAIITFSSVSILPNANYNEDEDAAFSQLKNLRLPLRGHSLSLSDEESIILESCCEEGQPNNFTIVLENLVYQIEQNERSQSLVFYFELKTMDALFAIIEEVNRFPKPLVKLHRWIFSIIINDETTSNITGYFSELEFRLAESTFFQENPLCLTVENQILNQSLQCALGYRMDLLKSKHGFVKTINADGHSCLSRFLEFDLSSLTKGFNGNILTAIVLNDTLYSKFRVKENNHLGVNSESTETTIELEQGFSKSMMDAMQFMLNVTMEVGTINEWGFISKETGRWIGAVGELAEERVDFCVTRLALLKERTKVIDFIMPLGQITINAYLRKINSSSYSSIKASPLLAPFNWNLWIAIAITLTSSLVISEVLRLRLQRYVGKSHSLLYFDDCQAFRECQSECKIKFYIFAFRIQHFCRAIVVMLLYGAYAGTLTSHLSIQLNPIQDVGDLISDTYSFAYGSIPEIIQFPLINKFIRDSPDPNVRELYRRVENQGQPNRDNVDHLYEAVQKIIRGSYIYLADKYAFYMNLENLQVDSGTACKIQEVYLSKKNFQIWEGPAVKKSSGIKKTLDFSIQKMMESGNVDLWKKRYHSKPPNCSEKTQFLETDLMDLRLAFYVLVLFGIMSLGILAVEYVVFKVTRPVNNLFM